MTCLKWGTFWHILGESLARRDQQTERGCLTTLTRSFGSDSDVLTERRLDTGERFVIGAHITNTEDGTLFLARKEGAPPTDFMFVIKYQFRKKPLSSSNKPPHPMLAEYRISYLASLRFDVSPKPFYVSPEFPSPGLMSGKCLNAVCETAKPPHGVRFMIMERVGASLGKLTENRVQQLFRLDARFLLRVMSAATDALASLHSVGIVHNDIHPGNICLRDFSIDPSKFDEANYDPTGQVMLIDFGVSRVLRLKDGGVLIEAMIGGEPADSLLSYGVLLGGSPSFREDLVRLVESVANLWRGKFAPFSMEKSEWTEWKKAAKFFTLKPTEPDPLAKYLDEANSSVVRTALNSAACFVTHSTGDLAKSYEILREVARFGFECIENRACIDTANFEESMRPLLLAYTGHCN